MKTDLGITSFSRLAERLPNLLDELLACPPCNRTDAQLGRFAGIYLFVEDGQPLYIGRTDELRRRIRNHTIPSANHNQATFAFILAVKEGAGRNGLTREQLQADPVFRARFTSAKARVAAMSIKFVAVDDPHVQTVFEVYAAMVLRTPHNDFSNH